VTRLMVVDHCGSDANVFRLMQSYPAEVVIGGGVLVVGLGILAGKGRVTRRMWEGQPDWQVGLLLAAVGLFFFISGVVSLL
jgi:hypothetical protein